MLACLRWPPAFLRLPPRLTSLRRDCRWGNREADMLCSCSTFPPSSGPDCQCRPSRLRQHNVHRNRLPGCVVLHSGSQSSSSKVGSHGDRWAEELAHILPDTEGISQDEAYLVSEGLFEVCRGGLSKFRQDLLQSS